MANSSMIVYVFLFELINKIPANKRQMIKKMIPGVG
jgi:hypothetical protein